MKTPLIVNALYAASSGSVATIDKAINLDRGAIAFYDANGTLIPDTVSSPADIVGTVVNAVLGVGDGKVININDITRSTLHYNYTPYAAKALKKMGIGGDGANYSLNLPSTIPAGAVAILHIYNKTQLNDSMTYKEVVVPVATGASAADVVNAVVSAVNKIYNGFITASPVATDKGISFVANATPGFDFVVTVGGILANADILEFNLVNHAYLAYAVNVVAYGVGNGTQAQVKAAEDYFFATRGDGNYDNAANDNLYIKDYLGTLPSYNQYNMTYYLEPYALKKSADYVNDLTIYIDSQTAGIKTSLDAILAAI